MNASSESGECASLISRGSFSVWDATCRAAMGSGSSNPECATRRRPDHRFTLQGRMKGRSMSVGTCVAYGRAYVCKRKPNIQTLTVQTRVLQLDGGNKMSDRVFEIDFAVQIWLPINIQQANVLLPSALREFLAKVGRHAGHIHLPGKNHVTRLRIRPGLLHHGAKDFAGGVINQGVPEIAGNGLVVMAFSTGTAMP